MIDLLLENQDLLETINEMLDNEEYINEGFFDRVREIISKCNKKLNPKETRKNKITSLTDKVTPYVRKKASQSQFNQFYNNNDYFIECVTGDEELCQIIANLLAMNYDIITPVQLYVITGKDMNKAYDLYGDNAYQDNVHHVVVPLKTLKNSKDIVPAKYTIKARYFNDVVDNNEYREYIAGRHEKSEQIQWIIDARSRN